MRAGSPRQPAGQRPGLSRRAPLLSAAPAPRPPRAPGVTERALLPLRPLPLDSPPPQEQPPPEPRAAMAENPGLENHRIKSFKNKGRDVEASVLRVCSGRAAGRGGARGRWLSPAGGQSELAAASGRRGPGCSRLLSGQRGHRGPLGARPRRAGAACCRRGRDVEPRRGPRAAREDGPGCCRPACRPHRQGPATARVCSRCSLPRCRTWSLRPSAYLVRAGPRRAVAALRGGWGPAG